MQSRRYMSISFAVLTLVSFFACTTSEETLEPEAPVEQEPMPVASGSPVSVEPDAELEQIKARLETVKTQLFDKGEYNCCIQPSCDWCALHERSCGCFSNLVGGESVCPGCGLGWHNGLGVVDGVDAEDFKWDIAHELATGGHQH